MSRIVEIERDSRPVNIKVGFPPAEEITVYIKWAIYKKKHKFLWKTWYTFDYDLTVPYISERPLSATERESNIKLNCPATIIKAITMLNLLQIRIQEQVT